MISIDYKSRVPIYEQLIENIKQLIIKGVYQRDDQLPSVRQLAGILAINPNTIQKAYGELERQGIIYSLKGKGNFVGSSFSQLQEAKIEEIHQELVKMIEQLLQLQISEDEIYAIVKQCYAQVKGGES